MITTFGEIMLRISPSLADERVTQADDYNIQPGGSESNVAIALSNLGETSQFITCLPDNPLAEKVIRQLKSHSVTTDNVIVKGERVGIYWTETGIGPRNSYVIYDRDRSAFSLCDFRSLKWEKILNNSKWFHFSGISPAVSENISEFLEKLVNSCYCPYSVDLNFRNKLWDWVNKDSGRINTIMTNLCQSATLIAGNESDFQNIFGFTNDLVNEDEIYNDIAIKCFEKFNKLKYLAISNRNSVSATINNWNGYLFIRDDAQFSYKGLSYTIDNIMDRVGTGDSFVAGLIYGILNKDKLSFQEIVDFAVTLSALNHTTKGDASFFSANDVFTTMKTKGSGRIIR
jgi:2-dehydro-3-deoxygluconokinase